LSHWIDRKDINLERLLGFLETSSDKVELDDDSIVVTNENNLHIYVSLDEDNGCLNWFCATKLNDGIDELVISRACKALNEADVFPCCYLSYDINEAHGIYAGGSFQLPCDSGISLETFMEAHRKFENSCVLMFVALAEDGFLELLEE
jgi:hypothetical protein